MSTKIYNGYIIRNVDYKDFFNKLMLFKNEITQKIEEKHCEYTINVLRKMKNKKEGLPKNYFPKFDIEESIEYKKNKGLCNAYLLLNEYCLKTDNIFIPLKFNICIFPNGEDILLMKFYQLEEYDDILNKYFKVEEYDYSDNFDAPYIRFKESDKNYISKEDWEKRKKDWENVLTEQKVNIPSMNGLQLNINYNFYCLPALHFDKIDKDLLDFSVRIKNEEIN